MGQILLLYTTMSIVAYNPCNARKQWEILTFLYCASLSTNNTLDMSSAELGGGAEVP